MGGGVSGLGNLGRGRGLEVQEIREEGGVKNSCHPSGVVDFFWNNPIVVTTGSYQFFFVTLEDLAVFHSYL